MRFAFGTLALLAVTVRAALPPPSGFDAVEGNTELLGAAFDAFKDSDILDNESEYPTFISGDQPGDTMLDAMKMVVRIASGGPDSGHSLGPLKYRESLTLLKSECDSNKGKDEVFDVEKGVILEPAKVERAMHKLGYTAVIQDFVFMSPAAASVCDHFRGYVGASCQPLLFVTPAGSCGQRVHNYETDVFVVQLTGIKTWTFYNVTDDFPFLHLCKINSDCTKDTTSKKVVAAAKKRGGVIKITLYPGDTMVVPRGVYHKAKAPGMDEELPERWGMDSVPQSPGVAHVSFHVSKGIHQGQLLRELLQAVGDLHHDGSDTKMDFGTVLCSAENDCPETLVKTTVLDQYTWFSMVVIALDYCSYRDINFRKKVNLHTSDSNGREQIRKSIKLLREHLNVGGTDAKELMLNMLEYLAFKTKRDVRKTMAPLRGFSSAQRRINAWLLKAHKGLMQRIDDYLTHEGDAALEAFKREQTKLKEAHAVDEKTREKRLEALQVHTEL